MAQTMLDRSQAETGRLDAPGQAGTPPEARSPAQTGWMWTWVIIGILVVLVVIAFLLGIISALTSIDDALAEADEAVSSIHGDVRGQPEGLDEEFAVEDPQPLPDNIANINSNLTAIDGELAAIPGQADDIIAALSDIRGTLSSIDSSLAGTSGTLQGTDASLADTLGIAESIRVSLNDTQSNPDNLGTDDIWQRVDVANGILTEANSDTTNILSELVETDGHLESICRSVGGPC